MSLEQKFAYAKLDSVSSEICIFSCEKYNARLILLLKALEEN